MDDAKTSDESCLPSATQKLNSLIEALDALDPEKQRKYLDSYNRIPELPWDADVLRVLCDTDRNYRHESYLFLADPVDFLKTHDLDCKPEDLPEHIQRLFWLVLEQEDIVACVKARAEAAQRILENVKKVAEINARSHDSSRIGRILNYGEALPDEVTRPALRQSTRQCQGRLVFCRFGV